MGCNSTYRLRYWNIPNIVRAITLVLSVATAPTVYGIETFWETQQTLQ